MATNFRISVHKNCENLHLTLMGDFDGTSAHELLGNLKRYSYRTSKVFVHTSCLGDIHPFGLNVFHNHLDVLKGKSLELVFTGENASQFLPEKPMFFGLIISTVPPIAISEITISSLSRMISDQKVGKLLQVKNDCIYWAGIVQNWTITLWSQLSPVLKPRAQKGQKINQSAHVRSM